jgi:hypothetical protein
MGVYILALATQHASRISSVHHDIAIRVFQDLPYLSTLYHKLHEIRKRNIEHKMYVLNFPTPLAQNISHSKENLARCAKDLIKVSVIPIRFSSNLYFLEKKILKILKHKTLLHLTSSIRVFPSGPTGGRKKGRTDWQYESNSRFRFSANTLKNFEIALSAGV